MAVFNPAHKDAFNSLIISLIYRKKIRMGIESQLMINIYLQGRALYMEENIDGEI